MISSSLWPNMRICLLYTSLRRVWKRQQCSSYSWAACLLAKKIQATSVAHAYLLGEPKDQHSEPAVSTTTRLPKPTAAGGRVMMWALPRLPSTNLGCWTLPWSARRVVLPVTEIRSPETTVVFTLTRIRNRGDNCGCSWVEKGNPSS